MLNNAIILTKKHFSSSNMNFKTITTKYLIIGAGFSGISLVNHMTQVSNPYPYTYILKSLSLYSQNTKSPQTKSQSSTNTKNTSTKTH